MNGFDEFSDKLIGFVLACLFCGAVDEAELRGWCALAIAGADDAEAPYYMYELMDFDDELYKIYKVIGYVPSWEYTSDEDFALYGIAVRRGVGLFDAPLFAEEAVKKLDSSPHVEKIFRNIFPFVIF